MVEGDYIICQIVIFGRSLYLCNKMLLDSFMHKPSLNIETPCPEQVQYYLEAWDKQENYVLQEKALDKLFFETYPNNTDINDILIKASSLNDFYSTNIFSIFAVAKHIHSLNIDKRLRAGDLSLVDDIAEITIGGKSKCFYSFASKYCSHHEPTLFPIYDYYVEKVLIFFRQADKFCDFDDADLKKYPDFMSILNAFQEFYGLSAYNKKDIDRYLWQLGKRYFPRNYKRKTALSETTRKKRG